MSLNQAVHFSGYEKENQVIRRRDVPKVATNRAVTDVNLNDDKKIRIKNSPKSFWKFIDEYESLIAPIIFTFLAFFTRLYKIGLSPIVTWDEAHFGKFGSHYIKREFYFDVHPPLGKMLVGLSGFLAGYNGTYEFKSGEKYPAELNYTFMRAFNALFGAVCVPLAYFTAREVGFSRPAIWFVALMVELIAHLGARVFGLIVIPIMIYMLSFALHFAILTNSGPGDAQMSSLFQANLKGSNVGQDGPLFIAYGSRVTIKNMGYGGGLLHSHIQTYPEGSRQQQVTCYHHKDNNNEWWIYPNRSQPEFDTKSPIQLVNNGDILRFIHSQTGRNLHSHEIQAPVTKAHWEVSCYGNRTVGDEKDHWEIEVLRDSVSNDLSKVRTLTTSFRIRHTVLGCYLRAGNINLPPWGFKQIEVTCDKKNNPRDVFTHWNIESHWNDRLPAADARAYKSPFLQDFIHLNVAMMSSNNALVPNPDKQDDLASKFWQWPILHVGLRMCNWDDSTIKYFLLGNPLVYWCSTFSLVAVILLIIWYLIRWQRGYNDLKPTDIDHLHYTAIYFLIGWVLHYLPFVAMARVTYVHHYYPALYFSILNFGFLIDWTLKGRRSSIQYIAYGVLFAITIGLYIIFMPISWGMVGPNMKYRYLKWFESWKVTD
ncbi:hypothetical protein EPUL_000864 [Erysiphe pulchra]|uniref:Dolichyl-phosphate-mannose--protein mannosyltransferase n=1 Tax=Erysiphe pulchra TaxID=225359 RepID=A0A2S4PZV5_9PEZI|nr:hypothetical protein EPUL_000864 [Erysiphe pulchra]